MNRLFNIITFWGLWVSFPVFSQEVPHTISFSQTSQKALDNTWMIAQDDHSFMYFANNEGLILYDGSEWQTFTLPHKQIIRSVAIDSKGNIFTGAYGEFGYWTQDENSQLQYHSLSENVHYNLAHSEEIWNIVVKEEYVLLQSFSTIYKYDYREVTVIKPPQGLTIMFIHSVRGRDFLQVRGKGVFEILPDGGFRLLAGSEALAQMEVVAILPYQDSGLIIGTSLNGLFIWDNGLLQPWAIAANRLFFENQLNKGIQLSSGAYAFGTILNGVYILNPDGSLKWNLNRKKGLQNNTVLSVLEDVQQNLWLGLDKGIDMIELNSPLIFFPDNDGFLGTVFASVLFEGQLYLGTNHGVYHRPWGDKSQKNFTFLPGSQGQVWELKVVDNQLFCGHNEGTFRINRGKLEKVSSITGGWMMLRLPDHPDKLIQCTYTGLVIFAKDQQNTWRFSHRLPELRDPIQKILFDKEGFLWALNPYKGLSRLKIDAQQSHIQTLRSFTKKDGLPSEFDLDITQFGDQIVIRSDNQFFTFDYATQGLLPIDSIMGQPLEPGQYSLINGVNDEWFKVYPRMAEFIKEKEVKKVSVSLVSSFTNIIALDSQYYLLGLNSGYALYKKNQPETGNYTTTIRPLITRVCLVSEKDSGFCMSPLTFTQPALQLKHNQNYLRFSFTYPDYSHSSRFRYRLDGFNETLSEWGNEHFKEYSNLAPGSYTFRVQNQWSENLATFSFSILPAWYETIWAQILWVILSMATVVLLGQYQAYRLEQHRREKERLKQQELEHQLMEARNEKLQLEVLGKSQELANSTMSLVRKNEILLDMKRELKKIGAEFDQSLPYKYYRQILRLIDGNITNEYDWQVFETNFNQVHDQFFKRLKADYPELTPGDLQLAAFLRINLPSKEIAPLLNMSLRGIENKRYRLRKKMGLKPEDNLTELLIKY
ncbi:MAG: triple tyrosine motif-containing protein [Bacteroidia bacterium]|nr:triple tyrosine motif-containing protein [Bacteroidia bacterium]